MARKRAKEAGRVTVEVLKCSAHRVFAVVIDGVRVTPEKCCGSWDLELRSWSVDPEELAAALSGASS